jgi:hypothetical protein
LPLTVKKEMFRISRGVAGWKHKEVLAVFAAGCAKQKAKAFARRLGKVVSKAS